MYITLAGDGGEFTNRLFNTINIKPYSYICLNNLTLKKNESIFIGDGVYCLLKVDNNNIYKIDISPGATDIYSLTRDLTLAMNQVQSRYNFSLQVDVQPDNSVKTGLEIRNASQGDYSKNLVTDTYIDVYNNNPDADIYMSMTKFYSSTTDVYDSTGYQMFMSIGPSPAEDYTIKAKDQPLTPQNEQTLGAVTVVKANAPTYVNSTGVPATGYDSTDPSVNLISNSMIQADYQTWSDENTLPISVSNLNDSNGKYALQADLLRNNGCISFIVGSGNSPKQFILASGQQDNTATTIPNYPQNFGDFSTGSAGIYFWMSWTDPRDSQNEAVLRFGHHKLSDGSWVTSNSRTIPGPFEITQAQEGNKFYVDFEPQDKSTVTVNDLFSPRVRMNTLSYAEKNNAVVTTVAFWDMDVDAGDVDFFDSDGDTVTGNSAQFNTTLEDGVGYAPLWANVGGDTRGNYCSSHYWGTELVSLDAFRNDGRGEGFGFQLATGVGAIQFNQASGDFPATATAPGKFKTGYGISRSFQNAATGYQNAFFKFPNMWGSKTVRDVGGLEDIEGTILPAQIGQTGTNTISICFRTDTNTANQIIFAYEGVDSSNDPHALLTITPNSNTGIKVSNGDPSVAEVLNIFEPDGTTPFQLPSQKWINIVVSFQSKAGPNPSNWIVFGRTEDDEVFRAEATACAGSPKRALFGIGGNDACNGTQTTNTGFGGIMKLFKICYYHGNGTAANTAYDFTTLEESLTLDMQKSQGDEWFGYNTQIKSFNVFDKDELVDGIKNIGQAKGVDALTICCGQHTDNSTISNMNPYDANFTGLLWRQNFQGDLSSRINETFVVDNTPIIDEFLLGGNQDTQGQGGVIAVPTTGSVWNDLGYRLDNGTGPRSLLCDIYPLTDIVSDNFWGSAFTVDTELGINNNRIHIENLPIQSYNGKVGSMDRCIYQTTAFLNTIRESDNSQVSCIDVPQKIYHSLNNAGDINLNEFNVKITNIDDVVDEEIISSNMTIEIKSIDELKITN